MLKIVLVPVIGKLVASTILELGDAAPLDATSVEVATAVLSVVVAAVTNTGTSEVEIRAGQLTTSASQLAIVTSTVL